METSQNVIFETPFISREELSKRTLDKRQNLETGYDKQSLPVLQNPSIGSNLLVPSGKTQQKRSKTQKKINIRIVGLDSQDDLNHLTAPDK